MMNMLSLFDKFLYPPPPSLYITAMSAISFISLANAGISEIKGKHLQYSKFWNANKSSQKSSSSKINKEEIKISSRIGMLILYTPAFLAGAISLLIFPNHDLRFLLVTSALTFHFFKRDFEVLFVHSYSGKMILDTTLMISLSYFLSTVSMIYNQHLIQGIPDPPIDLKSVGIAVFLVGMIGNFYHHYILSTLRNKNDKRYKIPKGGLFGFVVCPHYLFEILIFLGISLTSQTVYPFCFTIGTACYLTGRSYATKEWYLSKFPDFPKHVKSIVPFLF